MNLVLTFQNTAPLTLTTTYENCVHKKGTSVPKIQPALNVHKLNDCCINFYE